MIELLKKVVESATVTPINDDATYGMIIESPLTRRSE